MLYIFVNVGNGYWQLVMPLNECGTGGALTIGLVTPKYNAVYLSLIMLFVSDCNMFWKLYIKHCDLQLKVLFLCEEDLPDRTLCADS